MFNRAAVLYQDSALFPQGASRRSTWKDDLISQEFYGIRQKLLRRLFLHEQVADRITEKYLEEHAFLKTRLESLTKEDGDHFILRCKGWMHSLAWRVWEGWNGIVEHRPVQSGVQSLGMEAGCQRMAQTFTVPELVDSFSFGVRVRRQGLPSDRLVISLQADVNGKPSGIVLVSKDIQEQLSVSTITSGWNLCRKVRSRFLRAGSIGWYWNEAAALIRRMATGSVWMRTLALKAVQCFYIMEAAGLGETLRRICFFGSWVKRLWRGRSLIWSSLPGSS